MQPGAWEAQGFLLPSSRLSEILSSDETWLRSRGLDPRDLGRRLVKLLRATDENDAGRPGRVGDYEVEILRQRGLITCPWAPDEFEECRAGQGSRATANRFVIRHWPTRGSLQGFELTAHMIDGHGFFGGPGSRFRIEPQDLIRVLRPED